MKVVLDANVVVAAFASHGLCEAVFELCLVGHQLLTSEDLLEEVARNLRRKIRLPGSVVEQIVKLLRDACEVQSPATVAPPACRDPEDLHVLCLALVGKADCLITGDNDLLALKIFKGCRILTPREFSDLVHKQ